MAPGRRVVGFLPILYDLELGNVTVLVLVAVAAIAWTPDRMATGIPLGLILATAPKPQLIPVLVWLVVAHRQALIGAVATATLVTLVGLALTGLGAYGAWVDALRAPAYLNSGEVINLALWSLPPLVALPCVVAAIAAFVVALRRGYWPGLVAAICLGLLVAPYTLIYAAGLLPVVAPAAGTGVAPRCPRVGDHCARGPRDRIPRVGRPGARVRGAHARGGVAVAECRDSDVSAK